MTISRALAWTGLALMGWFAAPGQAHATAAGKVSFMEGRAVRTPAGPTPKSIALMLGSAVDAGDTVTTRAKGRLEITLADGSVMRVGPASSAKITEARFENGERTFSAKLILGHIWAKVSTALGGGSSFEVTTDRAVAGVRGTIFRVDSRQDKSVLVKVFAGAVAVAGSSIPRPLGATARSSESKGGRTQVAGPHEVTKAQWEKLVGAQMQIQVSSDGVPSAPEQFAEADACKDPWTRWNRARDGEPCPK